MDVSECGMFEDDVVGYYLSGVVEGSCDTS